MKCSIFDMAYYSHINIIKYAHCCTCCRQFPGVVFLLFFPRSFHDVQFVCSDPHEALLGARGRLLGARGRAAVRRSVSTECLALCARRSSPPLQKDATAVPSYWVGSALQSGSACARREGPSDSRHRRRRIRTPRSQF